MTRITDFEQAGLAPVTLSKSEYKPLVFIDNGGTVMAVIAFGADRIEVPASLVSEDNSESGRSYYSALQKLIEMSVVSSDVSARRAAAIALKQMREADGAIDDFVQAGAFLCNNAQRAKVFSYAKRAFATVAQFAAEHEVTEQYATDLLKECAVS